MIRLLTRQRGSTPNARANVVSPQPTLLSEATRNDAETKTVNSFETLKANGLFKSVHEELQCGVCLDEFDCPRLLNCGHSYCTACLNALHHGPSLRCPLCRQVTKFPNSISPSVTELPINYSIVRIQDILKHSNKKLMTCGSHIHEEIKFYCNDCDCLLCSECMVQNIGHNSHRDHVVVTMKQAAINLYHQVKVKQTESLDVLDNLVEVTSKLCEMKVSLENNRAGLKYLIDKEFADLEELLKKRRKELHEEVEVIYREKSEHLQNQIDLVNTKSAALKNATNKSATLLADHSHLNSVTETSSDLDLSVLTPTPSRPTSPTSVRRKSVISNKDVSLIWQNGPSLKKEISSLLEIILKETRSVFEAVPEYISCSFKAGEEKLMDLIKTYGTLTLSKEKDISLEVNVVGADGKSAVFKLMSWEHRVIDLMNRIEVQFGIGMSNQRLYHKGQLMYSAEHTENGNAWLNLSDFNVENGSTLYLNVSISSY